MSVHRRDLANRNKNRDEEKFLEEKEVDLQQDSCNSLLKVALFFESWGFIFETSNSVRFETFVQIQPSQTTGKN